MEFNLTKEQLPQNCNWWVPITPEKHHSESPLSSPTTNEYEIWKNQGNSNDVLLCDLNLQPSIPTIQFPIPMVEQQQTQLWFSQDNVDLDGLSCSQILGLADTLPTAIAHNIQSQSQFQSESVATFSINHQATPGKGKEESEVPIANSKNKKRKVGVDSSQKPGEKRKNKYYWAKIDIQKVATPKPRTPVKPKAPVKPKTPKVVTPKVGTPKVVRKKRGKKDVEGSKLVGDNQHETKRKPNCKKALNFEDDNSKIANETTRLETLKVYRRAHNFRCAKEGRRIGPSFPNSCKKKRAERNRRLIEELRPFKDFNYSLIVENLFDRLIISKGKIGMLLPTKVETIQKSFECVYSILSSPMGLRKKKRSVKRLASTNSVVEQLAISENALANCTTNNGPANDEESMSKAIQIRAPKERFEYETQSITIDETKVASERKPRGPYKRKEKRKDYLSNLHDWRDESLEQIMDSFIQEFESLNLYDDPRKLERWSVMLSEQSGNGGAEDNAKKEDAKFQKEKAILLLKMKRFLVEMTKFQGSKEFVKWNGSILDSVVGVFLTQNVSDVLSSNAYMELASRFPIRPTSNESGNKSDDSGLDSSQGSCESNDGACKASYNVEFPDEEETNPVEGGESSSLGKEYDAALNDMIASLPDLQGSKKEKGGDADSKIDWEAIRVKFLNKSSTERDPRTQDSVDWDAVRRAPLKQIADAIKSRGQQWIIAAKIQKVLNRLVEEHGTLDLEWLRDAPPKVAKAYLLSFYGLGLKSVECLRLLSLRHHGFPVDVNIGRIAIRLGWVPLKPLPEGLPFHLLQKYPLENEIQQYVWPKLENVNREFLYQVHYQMITFGKVFCMKKNPNCRACPFKDECKYYKSIADSMKMKNPFLPWRRSKSSSKKIKSIQNPFDVKKQSSKDLPALPWTCGDSSLDVSLPLLQCNTNSLLWRPNHTISQQCEPLIEYPESPQKEEEELIEYSKQEEEFGDIEDLLKGDDEYIVVELGKNLRRPSFEKEDVSSSSVADSSRALVSLSSEAASIPLPKQINPARLRTEHQVYELPYYHQLLKNLERQQGDVPYLLAIWTQGNKGQIEKNINACEGCLEMACSLESVPDDCSTVPGTILIPVRTAMRGFFPLNGTYFQVNEVFADYETSQHPINVPRRWIWMLEKRTLYCGFGTSSIMRGLTKEEIKRCCLEGYICTRGFDRQSRSPKPLSARFHSRSQVKGKLPQDEEEED